MTATAHLGLTIKQGATFREPLTRTTYPYPVRVECGQVVKECGTPAPDTDATPEDYTGCAARAQIRPSIDSAAIIAELTTENGGIILAGDTLTLYLSHTQTAAFVYGQTPPAWRSAIGQVEVTRPNGDVERQYEIKFTLSREGTL